MQEQLTRAEAHPCPLCGHPMVETKAGIGQWVCTINRRAFNEGRRAPRHHNVLSVWDEGRLDAWHSPV